MTDDVLIFDHEWGCYWLKEARGHVSMAEFAWRVDRARAEQMTAGRPSLEIHEVPASA